MGYYGKKIRTIVDAKRYDEAADGEDHTVVSYVEETDSPGDVLDRVNEVLEAHNLEIVEIEGDDPDPYPYVFTVEKI
jgi:hypothetical protein